MIGKIIGATLGVISSICILIIVAFVVLIVVMLLGGLLHLLWLTFLHGWHWLPIHTCGENEICQ